MNSCKTGCKTQSSRLPSSSDWSSPKRLTAFLLRLVESRDERDRQGLFYCEGLRFVARAVESPHCQPILFVYAPEMLTGHLFATRLLASIKERYPAVPLIPVSPMLLQRLSLSPEPQGIGMVLPQLWTPIHRLPPDSGLCYIALDTLRNPGNLGTILRTLEAVGGAGLICLHPEEPGEPRIDPFAPAVVRATMGSLFTLRFAKPTPSEWERWRKKQNVLLVGTSPHAAEDYRAISYGKRVVLWMGGERKGLSETQMDSCDHRVRIPMAPGAKADSLNIATATSVLLYEVFHQSTGPVLSYLQAV